MGVSVGVGIGVGVGQAMLEHGVTVGVGVGVGSGQNVGSGDVDWHCVGSAWGKVLMREKPSDCA